MNCDESPIRITNKLNLPSLTAPAKPTTFFQPNLELTRKEVLDLKARNDYPSALQKINDLINHFPRDIRSYQIKGELVYALKQYQQALDTYDQLLAITSILESVELTTSPVRLDSQHTVGQIKKMRALYYYNRGLCLQKLNRHEQAVQTLKKSIELNKAKLETYVCLGESYRALKQGQKLEKLYQKLMSHNPHKTEYLFKIIRHCSSDKEYQTALNLIEKGYQIWTSKESNQPQTVIQLLMLKGSVFKNMGKFEESIHSYMQCLNYELQPAKKTKVYGQMALCYDHMDHPSKAAEYYLIILPIDQNQLEIRNNLANLYIRQSKYLEAVEILSQIKSDRPAEQNSLNMLLLRSHRVIANSQLGRVETARKDLLQIIKAVETNQLVEPSCSKEWENYKFITYIVDKYKPILLKLSQLRESDQFQDQPELKTLEKEVFHSLSMDLQKQEKGQPVNLQKLEQRIDRLYKDIVSFKQKTLQQHQQNTQKVHNRILEIEDIMVKREADREKIERELQQMKKEHSEIYRVVQNLRKFNGSRLTAQVAQLKEQGKHQHASYAQQLYWLFNAYFIAVRLAANKLIPQPNNVHLNKVSSFFANFKSVFQTLSHIPQLGTLCEVVTASMSLYLSQESQAVYRILNSIITNNYTLEEDLQRAVESAVLCLIDSSYIGEALYNKGSILKELNPFERAYHWFKEKKSKVVDKLFKIDATLSKSEQRVRDLAIEDVTAVLVFLVKNKSKYVLVTETKPEALQEAVQKTLILGHKQKQINALFAEEVAKSEKTKETGERCSQCLIYSAWVPTELLAPKIDNNTVMDELIKEAIEQNNMDLFNYAVSNLAFK